MRTLFTALVALGFAGSVAHAQEFPPVYVLSEYDDDDAQTCQVSNASIAAAVESELRYNRIPVGTQRQFLMSEALRATVNTVILEQAGGCVVSYDFSLGAFQAITLRVKGKTRYAKIELCDKGGVMTGSADGLQSRLNAVFRNFTSECISEYLKE